MRHVLNIAMTLALCGCTMELAKTPTRPASDPAPRLTRKAATPTPSPTIAPTATPQAALTPAASMRTLTGVVRIDPGYIIAAGGGNLIGHAGGNIIAAGGGNLIGHAGGNLIGHAGGNYRLLQTDGLGEMLPAQGMTVEVVSLLTGERIAGPVGTDERGVYELEVSDADRGNLLVRAHPPAAENDPRLQYRLMVQADAKKESVLDEDTSLMTKLVVDCVAINLERQFIQSVEESLAFYPEAFQAEARPTIEILHREGTAANVAALDEEKRKTVLQRAARVLLSHAEFHEAKSTIDDEPALDSLVEVFEAARLGLERKLAENPNFSDPKQNPTGREILKVTDVGDYLIEVFKTAPTQGALVAEVGQTLLIIGVEGKVAWKLLGAYLGISNENSHTIQTNPQVIADIRRVLREGAAE